LVRSITEGRGGTFRVRPAPEQEQELVVEAVGSALGAGRSSLVIVPEAQPIPATAGAIVEAFGDRVGLFLGGDKRGRYRMWLDIRAGRYDVVVGTRPAVFAPVRDLGLVWLAREGHALHREERSPSFHVRDVAARRSAVAGAVFVMSAFCHTVEASLLDAVDVSPEGRAWPPVEVVRPGPEGRAPRLVAALKEVGRAFLYEPLPGAGVAQLCKACGEPAACAECGGMLRLEGGRVACVVCEAAGRCAHCGGTEFGIARGGAERVEAWVRRLVDVPVRRGDTLEPEGMTVGGAETVKEVPPPGLDLVGILDADLAARRPGLSAMERSLALWMDAASWAAPKGRVIVQTRRPSDPATQALVQGTPTRFHRAELARRAEAGFPVGHPVFRVSGKPELVGELRALEPVHLLETSLGEERVCLVTVRPDRLLELGRVLRSLAVSGTVIRVEAEPHL
jgi:primosomal protein N' (replication factor Y)